MENGTALIQELDSTADLDRVQEIYNEVLNFTADQAVLVPFTSAHQYAAFNSDKIASFTFGSDHCSSRLPTWRRNNRTRPTDAF